MWRVGTALYAAGVLAGAADYRGDGEDPRYEGWSYLGDRYRCPLAEEELCCHLPASRLLLERREDELRQMVDAGHRCALVRLMKLLVGAGRVNDLRAMALAGDDRAGVTLAEYWVRRGDQASLRWEVDVWPRGGLWLAGMLDRRGASDEARQVLAALVDNPNADEQHRDEARGVLARRAQPEGQCFLPTWLGEKVTAG
jgi:hypothetical protein